MTKHTDTPKGDSNETQDLHTSDAGKIQRKDFDYKEGFFQLAQIMKELIDYTRYNYLTADASVLNDFYLAWLKSEGAQKADEFTKVKRAETILKLNELFAILQAMIDHLEDKQKPVFNYVQANY